MVEYGARWRRAHGLGAAHIKQEAALRGSLGGVANVKRVADECARKAKRDQQYDKTRTRRRIRTAGGELAR